MTLVAGCWQNNAVSGYFQPDKPSLDEHMYEGDFCMLGWSHPAAYTQLGKGMHPMALSLSASRV